MTEQEQPNGAQTEAREIRSEKPPFDVNFFMQADQFSEYILQQTPELQAVAIIPIWAVNVTGVPNGRIRLRNEKPSYIGQLFQVMQKLAAFGIDVHRDLIAQIMSVDNSANNMAQHIKQKEEELAALNKQIEAAKSELNG